MRLFAFLLAWLSLSLLLPAQPVDSLTFTEQMRARQAAMPTPQTEFRAGHATPAKQLPTRSSRERGFQVQLPHRGLVPTPTVYDGKVFVSGGFGSKQFYALDAQRGDALWGVDLDDDGPSVAAVQDDIVVFNTESCTIFALNVQTGEPLWSYWLGDPLMSAPALGHGLVFTAYPASGGSGYQQMQQQLQQNQPSTTTATTGPTQGRLSHVLIAFDLHSGAIRWQQWIDGDIMSAPVVEGDELLLTTFPGTLFRFDARRGTLRYADAARATSAPVLSQGKLMFSQRADGAAGEPVREQLTLMGAKGLSRGIFQKNAPYLDAAVQDQSQLKAAAAAYDAGNGFAAGAPQQSGWQAASLNIGQSNVSSLQSFQGSRILLYGGLSFSSMGDTLVCTDTSKHQVRWQKALPGDLRQAGGFLASPPLAVKGKLVLATLAGEIWVLDAQTGKELQRYEVGRALRQQPVVDQGRIFLTTTQGELICIDTGDPDLTGWPTWGGNMARTNRAQE